jgi:hypothetical protein
MVGAPVIAGGITMKQFRSLSLAVALALAVGAAGLTTGCRAEGPAERAGEKLDRMGEKIEDAVDPDGPAERAGEKLDRMGDKIEDKVD